MINRRDFLTLTGTSVGLLAISNLLDSNFFMGSLNSIGNISGKSEKKGDFLDKNFELTENSDVFSYFVKFIEYIDDDVSLVRGVKLGYSNNKISIPFDFKYRDIPELIRIIKEKSNNPILDNAVKSIQYVYLKKATTLFSLSKKEGDLYYNNALKLFSIYSLFDGIKDEKHIYANIKKLDNDNIDNDLVKEVAILKERIDFNGEFEFSKEEHDGFNRLFKKDISEGFKNLKDFLYKRFPQDNGYIDFVMNKLTTKYKVDELFGEGDSVTIPQILNECQNLLNKKSNIDSPEKLKRAEKLMNGKIDSSIQIELKRDFEKMVFELMIKDINIKNGYKNIISEATEKIDKQKIINMFITYFINSKYSKDTRKKMFAGVDGKKIKTKQQENDINIGLLNENEQKSVKKQIGILNDLFDSGIVAKIQKGFKSGDYGIFKEEISKLKDEEKILLSYIMVGEMGFYLKFFLDGDDLTRNSSDSNRFEIKNLKRKNSKYNCMAISSAFHYIIEYVLGLESLGVMIFKYQNEKTGHFTNALRFGNEILFIDATYSDYFIRDANEFDDSQNIVIDNFANAYMYGSYYNTVINIKERNENPLLKLISFSNPKKENNFLDKTLVNHPSKSRIIKGVRKNYLDK